LRLVSTALAVEALIAGRLGPSATVKLSPRQGGRRR
jgi:hypothetical protein